MIASTRGKKPHVYRVINLKQTADHTNSAPFPILFTLLFTDRRRAYEKIDRRRLVVKTAVRTIPFCFQRVYSLDTSFVNCILNYNRIRNYAGRVVNDNNYSLIIY